MLLSFTFVSISSFKKFILGFRSHRQLWFNSFSQFLSVLKNKTYYFIILFKMCNPTGLWPVWLCLGARTALCAWIQFVPRCDFLLVRFRNLVAPDWLRCGCVRFTRCAVDNPHWPVQTLPRHWSRAYRFLLDYWLALLSSHKNAEVVESTESPLCQLILSEWVTRFLF